MGLLNLCNCSQGFVRLVAIEKPQRAMKQVSLFLVADRFDTVWAESGSTRPALQLATAD